MDLCAGKFHMCIDVHPKYCVPDFAGLLWLHVVITCPPPPHVHSEMPISVNSIHPDMTGYQMMTVEKHISHSLLTSYWVMSDDMIRNGDVRETTGQNKL